MRVGRRVGRGANAAGDEQRAGVDVLLGRVGGALGRGGRAGRVGRRRRVRVAWRRVRRVGGRIVVGPAPRFAGEYPHAPGFLGCFWCELPAEHVDVLADHDRAVAFAGAGNGFAGNLWLGQRRRVVRFEGRGARQDHDVHNVVGQVAALVLAAEDVGAAVDDGNGRADSRECDAVDLADDCVERLVRVEVASNVGVCVFEPRSRSLDHYLARLLKERACPLYHAACMSERAASSQHTFLCTFVDCTAPLQALVYTFFCSLVHCSAALQSLADTFFRALIEASRSFDHCIFSAGVEGPRALQCSLDEVLGVFDVAFDSSWRWWVLLVIVDRRGDLLGIAGLALRAWRLRDSHCGLRWVCWRSSVGHGVEAAYSA